MSQHPNVQSGNAHLSPKGHPNLASGFVQAASTYPHRPALSVDDPLLYKFLGERDTTLDYETLAGLAHRIKNAILSTTPEQSSPFVGILGYRSVMAYTGILGTLCAGMGYVPLNPNFPVDRNLKVLELSEISMLVVGPECSETLVDLLTTLQLKENPRPLTILSTGLDLKTFEMFHHVTFLDLQHIPTPEGELTTEPVNPDSTAYLLFTSGSTGIPKGVPVRHRNANAYVNFVYRRYKPGEGDRFSQTFELTFDLSVHDQFLCWRGGSHLCVPNRKEVLAGPAEFIRKNAITFWFSVPSVGLTMARHRTLTPHSFPSLKISLFCGEALPANLAQQWQEAAPNSVVDNLYGPTEGTIAISYYRWDPKSSPAHCINGIVPIGYIFDEQAFKIVDEQLEPIGQNMDGELVLGGSQVVGKYFRNPEKTAEQYVTFPDYGSRAWYRTGDLVRKKDGCLFYLGRLDSQIQVQGHRVEMQEVDHVLRQVTDTELAVAIPWPCSSGRADGIVGFVCLEGPGNTHQILSDMRRTLPEYMVPGELHYLKKMPLNASGKIDRNQLARLLDDLANASALISQEVRDFVIDQIREINENLGRHLGVLPENFDMFDSGLVNSVGYLQLLDKVENNFEIRVDFNEFDPADYTRINRLVRLITDVIMTRKREPIENPEMEEASPEEIARLITAQTIEEEGIEYRIMRAEDLEDVVSCFVDSFLLDEPLTQSAGLDFQELEPVVRHSCEKALENGLGLVARELQNGALVGFSLGKDYGAQDVFEPGSIFNRKFEPIFIIHEMMDDAYQKMHRLVKGKWFLHHALGINYDYLSKKFHPGERGIPDIAPVMCRLTYGLAKREGFETAIGHATSAFTQRLYKKYGFEEVMRIDYKTFSWAGNQPFKDIKWHNGLVLYEKEL